VVRSDASDPDEVGLAATRDQFDPENGLGEKILAGLLHPAGLLSCLRDQGCRQISSEAAEGARAAERYRGQISTPDAGDGDLAHAANSAPRLVRLSRVLERLADELACVRQGPTR
jgi:hypothetical protein